MVLGIALKEARADAQKAAYPHPYPYPHFRCNTQNLNNLLSHYLFLHVNTNDLRTIDPRKIAFSGGSFSSSIQAAKVAISLAIFQDASALAVR